MNSPLCNTYRLVLGKTLKYLETNAKYLFLLENVFLKSAANGAIDLWIEIGNPSSKKLHKATKTANRVIIYTYKSADVLKKISQQKLKGIGLKNNAKTIFRI